MHYFRLMENVPGRMPLGYGKAAGRWNLMGTPMIYACNQSSLNFLELLAIKGPSVSTASWSLVTLRVQGDIPRLHPDDLPADWTQRPYPRSTQEFGSQWAQGMTTPYLKVPSCRIPASSYPTEHNLLINPLHPNRTDLVEVINVEPVQLEVNAWVR